MLQQTRAYKNFENRLNIKKITGISGKMLYVVCGDSEDLYTHNPLRSLHTPSPENMII